MKLVIRITTPFCVSNTFKSNFETTPSFTKLQNRSLMIVHGAETRKFLQGLTTNNINLLFEEGQNKDQRRVSLYTLFLNPKGRVITDAFILRPQSYKNNIKTSPDDQLWIDVCKSTSTDLYEHLRKYTWKKKVQVVNLTFDDEKPDIFAGFNKTVLSVPSKYQQLVSKAGKEMNLPSQKTKKVYQQDGAYANLAYFDPRGINLGVRMVCGPDGFKYEGQTQAATQEDYNRICMLNGVTSSKSMVGKLPFMFNSDILNGFSFKKGCYLGQQIVARAYFTGIVRRRIFPFTLEQNKVLNEGQILQTSDKVQIGKVFESSQGCGTVLCNYLPLMQKQWPLKIDHPIKGSVLMPFGTQIHKYLKEIKQKQTRLEQIDL